MALNDLLTSRKSLGIWGFGVVGKSVAQFLTDYPVKLSVMEKRSLSDQEKEYCTQHSITFFSEEQKSEFLNSNDVIIPSPGIDLRDDAHYRSKFLSELDIFSEIFTKPIISVTGTVGKTSTTHFLSTFLSQSMRVATGGNIGTGMLDLIAHQENKDCAVLELSSFQLEYCKMFAPQLAIWTNLYPNHLDRHGTMEQYLKAKLNIMCNQKSGQHALVPVDLLKFDAIKNYLACAPQLVSFFSEQKIDIHELNAIKTHKLFWIEDDKIVVHQNGLTKPLIAIEELPKHSFVENWIAVVAAAEILNKPIDPIRTISFESDVLSHRLEAIKTKQGIIFFDDSKGTIAQSTLAAVRSFNNQPLVLMLGGLSKGVDRSALIAELPSTIKAIICFGKEADQLAQWCAARNFIHYSCPTLEDAFQACTSYADAQTPVLFSPSGSSYDLFTDYKMRGKRFKELVAQHYTIL
ncbi:MAG TPA: UDP-N-acetylmuramoyl-L-alanine--D-glutamate ligase [Candidatus Babeliales bacterium]|nr:UDP-N-acetylmuramoyl-L-alanine--D-glutamate ligase [Candidatus Babeliales bacterium]